MPIGPGKYDDLCTRARDAAKAKMAVLVIVGGEKGDGFSVQVQAHPSDPLTDPRALVNLLRNMADQIQQDINRRKGG